MNHCVATSGTGGPCNQTAQPRGNGLHVLAIAIRVSLLRTHINVTRPPSSAHSLLYIYPLQLAAFRLLDQPQAAAHNVIMPPITLEELEAQFKRNRDAAQQAVNDSEKSSETTEPVQPKPRPLNPLPSFFDDNLSFGEPPPIRSKFGKDIPQPSPDEFGRMGLGSPPKFGPKMPPKHGTKRVDEGHGRIFPEFRFDGRHTVYRNPPPASNPFHRVQDALNNRENTREPFPNYQQGAPLHTTAPRESPVQQEEHRVVDLPVYSQAYDKNPHAPKTSFAELAANPLPGLGANAFQKPTGASKPIPKSHFPQPDHVRKLLLPEAVCMPITEEAISRMNDSMPKELQQQYPTGNLVLQLSTEQLLDELRSEFDTKITLLEERLERKIRTELQDLAMVRDLETKLRKSEAEKEEYRKKVEELEMKLKESEAEKELCRQMVVQLERRVALLEDETE